MAGNEEVPWVGTGSVHQRVRYARFEASSVVASPGSTSPDS